MQGVGSTIRIECFAATRPQQGRILNEDAFLIGRGERPFAALCDGAGNAGQTAGRVLRLFEKMLNESTPEQITAAETWTRWVNLLDSSLLGGAQSTFLAVALAANEAVGVAVGDSRAYLINHGGQCRIVNKGASKQLPGERPSTSLPYPRDVECGRHRAPLERRGVDAAQSPLATQNGGECHPEALLGGASGGPRCGGTHGQG